MTQYKHIEGKGKPTKVVAPSSHDGYITKDRCYTTSAILDEDYDEISGWGFWILDDEGYEIFVAEIGCAHLNGGNWIVTEREQL